MVCIRFLLLSIFLALFSATAFADDLTPSEEGVCDSLLGGTAGLFGLCNAYCEAQDCDEYADGDQPRSCERLLINFNRIADGSGEVMPCEIGQTSCPCWTDDELAAGGLNVTPFNCHFDQDPTDDPSHYDEAFYFGSGMAVGFNTDAEGCLYGQFNVGDTNIQRELSTSAEENQVCRDEIHALHQLDFGGSETCIQFP